tara:strand:+ start:737 stop:1198 length:462 start_codon:yes stop_codon:yes gene_type:complete
MDLKNLLNQTTIELENEDLNNPEPEPESDSELDAVDIDTAGSIDKRFKQPWNKLEKGMKMNRILEYVNQEIKDKDLPDNISKELKNILFNACDRGILNKLSAVTYNQEKGIIESFKLLEYNESTKKFKINTSTPNKKSVSKSRSNIDRIVKKK